jgi:amino acid adenylation domain-containing protein
MNQKALDFVLALRQLGVQLSLRGDKLACDAPKGVLTPELKAQILERKAELLEVLQHTGLPNSTPETIERCADRAEMPLSSAQQRLWFFDRFQRNSSAYNICLPLEFKGALNVAALEASLRHILSRHEVLRSRVVNAEGTPAVTADCGTDWSLERHDLSAAEETEREEAAKQFARRRVREPFDLTKGTPFRASLARVDDRHHLLVLVVHHIVADGWSLGIILRELTELYAAYCEGRHPQLAELPFQYGDFARWHHSLLKSETARTQLQYWRNQLKAPLPITEFPTDHPRPAQPTYNGARQRCTFGKDLLDAVHQLCRTTQTTTFMVLIAAFKLLLHYYTRHDEIVVGSTVSGRSRPELEDLIGLFINNITLRTSLADDPSIAELISRVRQTCLSAIAHQDVPFDQVVSELQPDRSLSRPAIFQVMFNLQNFPLPPFTCSELSVRPLDVDTGTSRFDLTVDAYENEQVGLELFLEYNTDLFEPTTINRFVRHYRHLLASMAATPGRRISELSVYDCDEMHELLEASRHTSIDYPREELIHELVERQAAATPDRVALVCGSEQISYAELSRRSNKLANLLRGFGVSPDVLVGVCLERSVDMVVGLLGVLKAGGAYVPMDPHFPRERLAYMAQDAAVRAIITDEASRGIVEAPGADMVSLDGDRTTLDVQSDRQPSRLNSSNSLAYVIYTSGSTGLPKGVEIEHRSVVNFLQSMRREPGLTAEDRLLAVTTLSFDIAGLEIFLPLITGARIVLATKPVVSDGRVLARMLQESGITVMQATPATWRLLFESGWSGQSGLRAWCGGEAMPRALADHLLDGCGELWNLYGPTETTIWSTLFKVTTEHETVPIGRPIANTQVYILDEQCRPVPPGVAGELYIGGDGLARGYRNRPELTAEKFVAHPFVTGERLYRTGDQARFLQNGTLHFLGRLDHQVKIRGFRVELGEIESALKRCAGVAEAVVILREDEPGDQRLAAYLIPKAGAELSAHQLRTSLLTTLPEYMVPSAFVVRNAFPLTPNGKLDRRALPAPERHFVPAAQSVPATTEAEKGIAGLWKELLKREGVGIHDNFFDLGGHSLLLVQLQSRLRHRFGREIPMIELFQKPTIASMASYFTASSVSSVELPGEGHPSLSGTAHA